MGYIAAAIAASAAVSAGTSIYGANQASDQRNQALSNANSQIQNLSNEAVNGNFLGQFGGSDIFGSVPNASLYNPVPDIDFTRNQNNTINGNLQNFPGASQLAGQTNAFNLGQSLNRINALVPNYSSNLNQMGSVTQSLLQGKLPYSDVLGITGNSSELGANVGVPGGSTNATLKDLGLSQMNAEQQGGNMFEQMVAGAQQVMPTSALTSPSSMFMSPTDTAQMNLSQRSQDIEQAQLEQQSGQNANNLAASADPEAASLFNLYASMIPATLGVSTSGNLGAGIAGAGTAASSGIQSLGLLGALQSRGANSTTYGGSFLGGYNTNNGQTFTTDANGNLIPSTTALSLQDEEAAF